MVKSPQNPVADKTKMLAAATELLKKRTQWETIPPQTSAAIDAIVITLSNPRFIPGADWNTVWHKTQREKTTNLAMRLSQDGIDLAEAAALSEAVTQACIALVPVKPTPKPRSR